MTQEANNEEIVLEERDYIHHKIRYLEDQQDILFKIIMVQQDLIKMLQTDIYGPGVNSKTQRKPKLSVVKKETK